MDNNTLDILNAVENEMNKANSELREASPDKFNRALLKLIQEEIVKGKSAAFSQKYMNPGVRTYTHKAPFPMAMFENISQEVLIQLSQKGVYLHSTKQNTAQIQIVFHF